MFQRAPRQGDGGTIFFTHPGEFSVRGEGKTTDHSVRHAFAVSSHIDPLGHGADFTKPDGAEGTGEALSGRIRISK